MDAIVAQLAVSPVPLPMPVVVHHVIDERLLRGRPLPARPVEPRGNFGRLAVADARPAIVVPGAGIEDLADCATLDQLDSLRQHGTAPPLASHLNHTVVFARGFDRQLSFPRIVTARLLDIDVLARCAAENRRRGMPVIRGGTHQRVDRLVVERLAKIGHALRPPLLLLADRRHDFVDRPRIDIADVRDFAIRLAEKAGGQRSAAAVDAHDRDGQRIAR